MCERDRKWGVDDEDVCENNGRIQTWVPVATSALWYEHCGCTCSYGAYYRQDQYAQAAYLAATKCLLITKLITKECHACELMRALILQYVAINIINLHYKSKPFRCRPTYNTYCMWGRTKVTGKHLALCYETLLSTGCPCAAVSLFLWDTMMGWKTQCSTLLGTILVQMGHNGQYSFYWLSCSVILFLLSPMIFFSFFLAVFGN